MNMPIADLLDRLSILYLKKWVGGLDVEPELLAYETEAFELTVQGRPMREWLVRLVACNALIWSAEADLRRGVDMPLAEIGRRALNVRDFNRLRIATRNEIAAACGETQEIKVNHGSA